MAKTGEEADRLDGQRHPAGRAVRQQQAALQLLPPALRPGHQPADRPDPRAAGDVAGVLRRSAPQPARHQRDQPAVPPRGHPAGPRPSPTWRSCAASPASPATSSAPPNSTSATRWPGARKASKRAWPPSAPKPRTRCSNGSNILIVSDRKVDADNVAIPALLATSAIHQHLVDPGPAHPHRPGGRDRLRPRGPPLRGAGRLRRRGRAPLPGPRDPGRAAPRATPPPPTSTSSTSSRPSARAS